MGVLFHLVEDPLESTPRHESDVELRMDKLIEGYSAMKPYGRAEAPALSQEDLEKLQSLGYLMGAKPQQDSIEKHPKE